MKKPLKLPNNMTFKELKHLVQKCDDQNHDRVICGIIDTCFETRDVCIGACCSKCYLAIENVEELKELVKDEKLYMALTL